MAASDAGMVREDEVRGSAGVDRRTLLIGAGSTAVLLGVGGLRYVGSVPQVRPPGGQDEDHLIAACIRCNRCVEACPMQVIVPSRIEYGILGMRTPRLEFSENPPGDMDGIAFCDFCAEANDDVPLCVQVCPTEALKVPEGEVVEDTILGIAELDKDLCMAYRSGFCAFCHDACIEARGEEAAAIYYVGSEDGTSMLPVVDAERCNGCGACESVCVSIQDGSVVNAKERAIVVRSLEYLEVAE
ncbi:4Fe-4S dicluster domain-containing protein [Slackia heliotrinireducens]|uniref:4Fe-4S dicluster domain-containing protein n=1 Tax=Slackia heliotrinireducens TaxID=84110 RepID=UPI0033153A1C